MAEKVRQFTHYIDGRYTSGRHCRFIDSIDPATGAVWAKFARGDATIADAAVQSSHTAFKEWSDLPRRQRYHVMLCLAEALENRWDELVGPEIRDNGKRIAEVRAQFAGLHNWFRYFAEQGMDIGTEAHHNTNPAATSETHYVPYGVVVAITPWNSPLMILAWKVAPALIAGNTVVIKPSEHASASTLEFARLATDAGLPKGVLNVTTGYGEEIGEALVRHPLTRKVTFTGSYSGGRQVARTAADSVIPSTLELGGKSPQIVFEDADLESTLNGIMSGIFLSNGQTCVAGSRLIVHEIVKDKLIAAIISRANALQSGNPMHLSTQIGPLANKMQLDKVLDHIETAKREGALCRAGGERAYPTDCPNGYFVEPTVFDNVNSQMRIWNEEIFGPVLAVTSFRDEQEAIRLANDGVYGLAAGVWTEDLGRANRIAREIDAGTVYINHYRSVDPAAPIGGMKSSGYGRELGPNAVKEFLQVKSIWTGTLPIPNPYQS